MDVVLYSTKCPKCNILEEKLDSASIDYNVVYDVDLMIDKGFKSAPMLEVDGEVLDFKKAVDWVNNFIGDK